MRHYRNPIPNTAILLPPHFKGDLTVEINGTRFPIFKSIRDYRGPNCTPVHTYFVRVSPDYNPSGKFNLEAKTIKGLISAIRRYPDRLVHPDGR